MMILLSCASTLRVQPLSTQHSLAAGLCSVDQPHGLLGQTYTRTKGSTSGPAPAAGQAGRVTSPTQHTHTLGRRLEKAAQLSANANRAEW